MRSQQEELKKLEDYWGDIFVRADAEALEKLLMDDFVYTSSRGEVLHKAQYLANLSSGEVKIEAEKYSELEVRQHGDTAVVTGVVTLKATYQEQDISGKNLFTKVWVKYQEQWKALALHACLYPQE